MKLQDHAYFTGDGRICIHCCNHKTAHFWQCHWPELGWWSNHLVRCVQDFQQWSFQTARPQWYSYSHRTSGVLTGSHGNPVNMLSRTAPFLYLVVLSHYFSTTTLCFLLNAAHPVTQFLIFFFFLFACIVLFCMHFLTFFYWALRATVLTFPKSCIWACTTSNIWEVISFRSLMQRIFIASNNFWP